MSIPTRQIRAVYDEKTIRVYQAYNDAIADSALQHGTFVSPPFKMERMTWIKPSFLWMMYRSGWGKKDSGQSRVLALDITREGFDWALAHSLLSHQTQQYADRSEWQQLKNRTPVRIQWDPERDLHFRPLDYRAIQIGLSNEAVKLYTSEWIQDVVDVTPLADKVHQLVQRNRLTEAESLLPDEAAYPVSDGISKIIKDSQHGDE